MAVQDDGYFLHVKKLHFCRNLLVSCDNIYMKGKYEILSPEKTGCYAEERLKELKKARNYITDELKKAPCGTLYVRTSNGSIQFYSKSESEPPVFTYIKNKDVELAEKLSQKRYNKKALSLICRQIKLLEKVSEELNKDSIPQVLYSIPEKIQRFILPVTLSDSEYSKKWSNVSNPVNNFHQKPDAFFTLKGEKVRSKSEVIIADTLNRMKIPYRYEFPVELKRSDGSGTYTVFPDFYCLNVRTRTEYIWEHFGMMENPEYARKMMIKMSSYQKSGWIYGRNLIFSMESTSLPLNVHNIQDLIKEFLQ